MTGYFKDIFKTKPTGKRRLGNSDFKLEEVKESKPKKSYIKKVFGKV